MKMFEEMADAIFKEAGAKKDEYPDLWQQCVDILSMKMASLSVTHGLSYERVDIFEKQKATLVEDLREIMKGEK